MASLYERSNGTYYANFYESNRSPNRKRFSLKTSSKQTARRKLTELENAYVEGDVDPWASDSQKSDPFAYDDQQTDRDYPVSEVIDRFAKAKEKQGRSERTIDSYRGVWRRFTERIGEETPIAAVTASNIEAYCHDRSVSDSTRHKRWRHVRAVFNWAEDKGILSSTPLENVNSPQREEKLPTPVRKEDLPKICKAQAERYRERRRAGNCSPCEMVWAIPVFRWAFYTGMRSTEIGRLKWKHIDKEHGLIKITRQKNRKEQTIPLISKAEEVLRHTPIPREPEMYVFRTPDGPLRNRNEEAFGRSASRHFCKARRRSEIDRELTFHDLRAGFATALADAGKSAHTIRAAMRHSSLKMALRYVSVSNVRLRSEMSDAL